MKMTEKFKILGKFIKDLSSETPNIETYLFVKDRIESERVMKRIFFSNCEYKDTDLQYAYDLKLL